VEIEQLGANKIEGDIEVLEVPCGDGVWHRERCPLTLHFNVPHCKNPPSILVLQR
jgi:hypothetical protein